MHRRRPALAFVALALSTLVAAPAAAENNYPDKNSILVNGWFNAAPTSIASIKGWTTKGTIRTERFGTRSFPSRAYGNKYRGGDRYLSCFGGAGGAVTQKVAIPAGKDHRTWRARFQVSQGGVRGHRVLVMLEALDASGRVLEEAHQTKVLEVTNHYKKSFTSIPMRPGTTHVRATLRLRPKTGSTRCKVVADTANLVIVRAS
jgi:hypothetical protein